MVDWFWSWPSMIDSNHAKAVPPPSLGSDQLNVYGTQQNRYDDMVYGSTNWNVCFWFLQDFNPLLFTNDKKKCTHLKLKNWCNFIDRMEKSVGRRENAGYFSCFPTMFSWGFLPRVVKVGIVFKGAWMAVLSKSELKLTQQNRCDHMVNFIPLPDNPDF